MRQGEIGGAYVPPAELWWIDWYDAPLTLAAGAVLPADGEASGNSAVDAYLDLRALLDLVPGLQLHFVFLSKNEALQTAGAAQPADGRQALRFRKTIRPQPCCIASRNTHTA